MTQRGRSDSGQDPGQAMYVWLAGTLGRPLTQDEAAQFMVLMRQYVAATIREMQRLSRERGQ